ncbi:MAG TPA: hypothetical protein VEW04_03190 [Allosphingosinicella sp.]|nr:hypothetical protein [Allosphingosinicella sp.]
MKPVRAFLLSMTGGLALFFGAHATLTVLTAHAPDVQIGPLPTA